MTVADSTSSGLGVMGLFQYLKITALQHSDCTGVTMLHSQLLY